MFSLAYRSALIVVFLLVSVSSAFAQASLEDLRIEIPQDANVRIENQFGEVAAEVWPEKYLSVSAVIDGETAFRRSPVVIENRPQLVSVSVLRRRTDPAVNIKLIVKVPESARVEIISGKHDALMIGLPASASLRTTSGNVRVQFQTAADADINARSTTGTVKSELPQFLTDSGHVLQARLGAGTQTLKITSQSGAITLVPGRESRSSVRRESQAIDEDPARKAVGTPAPLTDVQEISEGDVVRVDSQMVSVNLSVIDRNTNRGLLGLTKSNFRLFENGAEQEILQFESSSAPFDLVLLIDLSGSTRDKVKLIRAAALRFISAARAADRIGVIAFAGQAEVISPLTLNRSLLRQRVGGIDTTTGDTKLYDATDFAVNQVLREAANRRRTAIVLMSDGLDGTIPGVSGQFGSMLPYRDLLNRLQEFDGVLYTLWLNTYYEALNPKDTQPEAFDTGHDRMKEMADTGGGVFYEVERLEDLAGAYERVVADLGTVYTLAYRPADNTRDGKWRAIRVNIDRFNAVARGKRGYYAN